MEVLVHGDRFPALPAHVTERHAAVIARALTPDLLGGRAYSRAVVFGPRRAMESAHGFRQHVDRRVSAARER